MYPTCRHLPAVSFSYPSCENNYELPLLAHSELSTQLACPLRTKSGHC
nr:MAG TPA: hypothetical protein [Caudoviricetes sp.]